jgi:Transglycosylase SLT domain
MPRHVFLHTRTRITLRSARLAAFAPIIACAFASTSSACAAAQRAYEPRIDVDSAATVHVADVPASAFRNANGSPRLRDDQYRVVRQRIVPQLERWSRDARLAINPAYVTALMLKESGGDSLAVSSAPALGLAQLTASADSDMRLMVTEYHFQWMAPEVNRWPRFAPVQTATATQRVVDSLLADGAVNSRNEYLFDPGTSARAAVFWIRLLENKWTTDFWPGGYGPTARARLNGGRPLTQHQMFDLVTVSYNRGYIEVKALVDRYGAEWTSHLAELTGGRAEAADYLERVRAYTAILEGEKDAETVR